MPSGARPSTDQSYQKLQKSNIKNSIVSDRRKTFAHDIFCSVEFSQNWLVVHFHSAVSLDIEKDSSLCRSE
jgi:hypothetical protein